jgi:c-di-GMP-binding flagellar brake protein YcgR
VKGLAKGQDVFVIAPSGAPVSARIDDLSPKDMLLSLFSHHSDPAGPLAGNKVELQFVARRGVCRMDGEAQRSRRGTQWLIFAPKGEPRVIQRREFVRVDAVIPVEYAPFGTEGYIVKTHTMNLSGGGFLLAAPEALRIGETMEFTLDLSTAEGDDAGLLVCDGKAVRQTDGGALGIEFLDLSEDDRGRVIRFVFARERLARQVTRDG